MPVLSEKIYDPQFDLSKRYLIAASAGTGKTYSIQSLYLRLILEKGLTVQQILVVTFTDAASKELRERLRGVVQQAADDLESPQKATDERIKNLLGLSSRDEAQKRVRLALLDFDLAAIYTIHSFCQRALKRFAFETGQSFDLELKGSDISVIENLCEDWIRQHLYGEDNDLVRFLSEGGLTRTNLIDLAKRRIAKPDAEIRPEGLLLGEVEKSVKDLLQRITPHIESFLSQTDEATGEWSANLKRAKAFRNALAACHAALVQSPLKAASASRAVLKTLKMDEAQKEFKPKTTGKPRILADFPDAVSICKDFEKLPTIIWQVLVAATEEICKTYKQEKATRRTLSYDDLLLNLRDALHEETRGNALKQALRAEFKAALIDEFQDTDPVQYGIFETLFDSQEEVPCFFVGDPKQAIYGFRGGDIYTYLRATHDLMGEQSLVLNVNFRAEKRLIDAVNQIFADDEKGPTFCNSAMAYPGDLLAKGKEKSKSLTVGGEPDQKPFKLWYYEDEGLKGGKPPGQDSPFATCVYAETALEIQRLLEDKQTLIAGKRVQPSDIAILVLTHQEAGMIARELAKRNIPVVRSQTQKVFDTQEAQDFAIILAALADPRDGNCLRAALATRVLGFPLDALALLNREGKVARPAGWPARTTETREGEPVPSADAPDLIAMSDLITLFDEANDLWRKKSFITAFNHLVAQMNLRARLAALPEGERTLTNVMQLAEIIHSAVSADHLSLEATLAWYTRQLSADDREENDENEMRLETDQAAVKIMTVFKSKGLEFPIVFVPTLWRKNAEPRPSDTMITYHENDLLCLDLDKKREKEKALEEQRDENIRIAYVALTRASHRTYLAWANFEPDPNTYALAWIMGNVTEPDRFGKNSAIDVILRPVTESFETRKWFPNMPSGSALTAQPKPVVDKKHGHGSFSSLIQAGSHANVSVAGYDFDAEDVPLETVVEHQNREETIFSFPSGAKTGECWHEIFEELPFSAAHETLTELVTAKLEGFGLIGRCSEEVRKVRIALTCNMVKATLNTPLKPQRKEPFCLREIAETDKLVEMEFNFTAALGGNRTTQITEVLQKHWKDDPGKTLFLKRLEGWDRELPGGFMTGFMDLVFRHEQQYYIADWKSNRRNGSEEDFKQEGLIEEMAVHAYFLQYLVYTVALHQFLKGRLQGYSYEVHFGGVFYLFLRGMGRDGDHGIFYDRPSLALIEDLSKVLGAFV